MMLTILHVLWAIVVIVLYSSLILGVYTFIKDYLKGDI